MDLDFIYDEMESGMEVDSDPPDPLGIPNTVAAQNWTYSGAEKFNFQFTIHDSRFHENNCVSVRLYLSWFLNADLLSDFKEGSFCV